jgi:hypothetical protein
VITNSSKSQRYHCIKAQFPNTNERKDLLYEKRKKRKNKKEKRRWVVPVKRREDGAEARRCGAVMRLTTSV